MRIKGLTRMFRGLPASTRTTPDAPIRQSADPLPQSDRFSAFFAQWVCSLASTPPHVAASPPPNGGNGVIRTTTRRRHADSQPLMLQNPHRHRRGGHRRDRRARAAAPERSEGRAAGHAGRGARGRRGLAGQRANVPIKARGADGRSGRADTTASRISHVIPPQHESTQAQKPQNINDQNPNPDMRSRELHAKLLVDSHSWASRRCTEPHVSTLSSPAAHSAPPAPKQPAGPQATASATQQHVVSYNPSVIMGT